jgi:hypothetical protein
MDGKQEQAIAALLLNPTIAAAALSVKVSERTLRRWLQEPEFQKRYREARRAVVDDALCGLQRASTAAVETLVRNLTCGDSPGEIRAAMGILQTAIRAVEIGELKARVEDLERIIKDKKP